MYNIVYSSSDFYSTFCHVSICSLLENNPDLEDVNIYILSNDITESNIKKIQDTCAKHMAELHIVNTDDIKNEISASGGTLNFNISSFIRIFISKALPNLDKALFIDSDTFVQHGIKELYETDIDGQPAAMVCNEPIYREFLQESQLPDDSLYFNGGVILFNLKYWRENRLTEKIMDFYLSNGGNFSVDDQSVINGVIAPETINLPQKFNAMQMAFSCSLHRFNGSNLPQAKITRKEYMEAHKSPVIIHFNGPGFRPWEKFCGHCYRKSYRKVLYRLYPSFKLLKHKGTSNQKCILQYIWKRFICPAECLINNRVLNRE